MQYPDGGAQLSLFTNVFGSSIINYKKWNPFKNSAETDIKSVDIDKTDEMCGFFRDVIKLNCDEDTCNFVATQTRISDYASPNYLIFEMNNDIILEEFTNQIGNIILTISSGGTAIWKIPISFCLKFNDPVVLQNQISIKIPFEILSPKLPTAAIQYRDINYAVKLNTNIKNNLKTLAIHTNNVNVNGSGNKRKSIVQKQHELHIQQLQTLNIFSQESTVSFNAYEHFQCLTKGFFIEANVNNLINFKMEISDVLKMLYDKMVIKLYCKQFNDNLLYIPITEKISWDDLDDSTFYDATHLSRSENIKITLKFSEPQKRLLMYALSSNVLNFSSAGIGCRYSNDNGLYSTLGQQTIYEPILGEKDCCISHESMTNELSYYKCAVCNNIFTKSKLDEWFAKNKNCPMCRSVWKGNIVYMNSLIT